MSQQTQPAKKNQYGLLSMISIIIGTVIGSGIYVKNSSIMEQTGSTILSTISWVIGGLLVLAILIAIIEIASISKKKNEQGTLNAWTKYFWGPKISRFVGIYFLFFYFPLVAASESIFSINQLFEAKSFNNQVEAFFIVTILSIAILVLAFAIASLWVKPTKAIIGSGTIIKIIPLALIVFIMALIGIGFSISDSVEGLNPIFDPNAPINNGLNGNENFANGLEGGFFNNFSQVLLVLPAILFAFDGFLYSASLSTEAKSENTFKFAAIISIAAITLIYILFSLSTYALTDVSDPLNTNPDAFNITSVMHNVFGENDWIVPTISVIIALSILTAVFGYATSSMWTMADASNKNDIVDKNGSLIQRKANGNPYKSGLLVLFLALGALVFMRSLDIIAWYATYPFESSSIYVSDDGTRAYIGMTDYVSNLYSVINFTFYTLIILGGLRNRVNKKIEVDKSSLFIPAALIAIVGMGFVVTDMTYNIIRDLWMGIASNEVSQINLAVIQLVSIIIIIGGVFAVYIYQTKNIYKQDPSVWENKVPYQNAYDNHMTLEEYVRTL